MADNTLPPVGATVVLPLAFGGRWTRDADGWLSDGGLDLPDYDIWCASLDRLATFEALAREAVVAERTEYRTNVRFLQAMGDIVSRLAALAPKEEKP